MPYIIEADIDTFIKQFKRYEKNDVLKETFIGGYCYYFALILQSRFPEGEIYYHLDNHYVYKLNDRLYDITGDCTDEYNNNKLMPWKDVEAYDSGLYKNLIQYCVLKNELMYP